ncbi:DNA cytosine methyltransferase [Neptunomonas antarctica]|uniref:DNA (cytosine-5-)-methyltransferase n=1 Tax=Neptunomonas antarctica TaxID=619304 RepID=A0A1N7P9D6_9GAMM|nr:DNA cytosine methyltransferase [Neptunomonas antarctica]SIT07213.1 DNA (cytosine-5)-methyltransferase 1 [Neptunomonas antarctica]
MILSLFCGAGGLDLGFEQAGFEIKLAFDIRKPAVETYNHNRIVHSKNAFVKDISTLTIDEIDLFYGGEFNPIGIIGGPPCQSFSISNTTYSEDDKRHSLPLKYAALLKKLNNRNPIHFFVFENVPGLKSKRHIEKYNEFKRSFENAGFTISEILVNSINYDVPQNRERLFIIGLNKEIYQNKKIEAPIKTSKKVGTVKTTIAGFPEPIYYSKWNKGEVIPYHPNHWCMTPKSKKFTTTGALVPGSAIGRSFRTLHWDKPSPTVAYGNREVHIHPSCKRRLSVYEAMLLQGFPHSFEFKGTMSAQFSQVSEAVPPPLGRAIALKIKESCNI